jgi:hypothetical protein
MFFGISSAAILEGVSTTTGSSERKLAESIKKVTNKNAKSTIGVMSMVGDPLGPFTSAISFFYNINTSL